MIDSGEKRFAPLVLAKLILEEHPDGGRDAEALSLVRMSEDEGNASATAFRCEFEWERSKDKTEAILSYEKALNENPSSEIGVAYSARYLQSLESNRFRYRVARSYEDGFHQEDGFFLVRDDMEFVPATDEGYAVLEVYSYLTEAKRLVARNVKISLDAYCGQTNQVVEVECNQEELDELEKLVKQAAARINGEESLQSFNSHFDEALERSKTDRDLAISLYELCLQLNDNPAGASNNLAILIKADDPDRAKKLYAQATELGDNLAPRNHALLVAKDDPELAIELFAKAAKMGNFERLAGDLVPYVREGRESAIELYKDVLVGTDGKHAYELALILEDKSPEEAINLYEVAINAGDELNSTYKLARLISGKDRSRAMKLYERSMKAGDNLWAPNALANLIGDEDKARARKLYELSIANGDEKFAPNGLANLIKADNPEHAIQLYERAINAGDHFYAPCNLADLILNSDPARARVLYEMSMGEGKEPSLNNYGCSLIGYDNQTALEIFMKAFSTNEAPYAKCNYAHLCSASEPDLAIKLYKEVLESMDEVEAKIGLAVLTRDAKPNESKALISDIRTRCDLSIGLAFYSRCQESIGFDVAYSALSYLVDEGISEAGNMLLKLFFEDGFDSDNLVLKLGTCRNGRRPIEWFVIEQRGREFLLLSKHAITKLAYADSGVTDWATSTTRQWLNSDFLNDSFSDVEEKLLVSDAENGDKVCLLGLGDLEKARSCKCADGILLCSTEKEHEPVKWWLLSTDTSTASAPCISEEGQVGWGLSFSKNGVRPTIRIAL